MRELIQDAGLSLLLGTGAWFVVSRGALTASYKSHFTMLSLRSHFYCRCGGVKYYEVSRLVSNPVINPSKWPHYPHHKTIKQNPHGLRSLRVLIVANSSSIQYLGSQDSSYFSNVCFHHFLERVISYQELGWRETERIYQESDTGTNCQTHAATRSCLEIRWTRVNRKPVID